MGLLGELKKLEELQVLLDEWKVRKTIPKVILFDMDGTLLHTEPVHAKAIAEVLPPINFPLNYKNFLFQNPMDLHEFFRGQNDYRVFEVFKEIFKKNPPEGFDPNTLSEPDEYILKKNEVLERVPFSELEPSFPIEMKNFLDNLIEIGVKLALVSASQKPVVVSFSKKLTLERWFDFMMGAEDTKETKPHPMPYLEAMRRFEVTPSDTLIFEDSESGLTSALSSGAHVYKVSWF